MKCRHCGIDLTHTFLDLGFAPPSNSYLTEAELSMPEKYYPLKIKVCDNCWLVQTEDYAQADELFSAEYAYFSSTSSSWLEHAKRYTDQMVTQLSLNASSYVIQVASNDGYLLKNFVTAGIPCLGIEPTASTADAGEKLGIPVVRQFFGENLGKELVLADKQADLIIGNNVYAHVPDINDFTRGLKAVLKPNGIITLEFPHLLKLIEQTQFDTVYHEHFSYLSLNTVERIFRKAGLRVWHVEQLPTHGGSLRVFGCHEEAQKDTQKTVAEMLKVEQEYGLNNLKIYLDFQSKTCKLKDELLSFLINQKKLGKKVVAYGAAAKGSTFLNYAGIKPDLLPVVCDAAVAKQGKFMPGSHIPIVHPNMLVNHKPDFILILPWNICNEVINQLSPVFKLASFVVAVPQLEII
jgi:SAM-dependent methyltransferase